MFDMHIDAVTFVGSLAIGVGLGFAFRYLMHWLVRLEKTRPESKPVVISRLQWWVNTVAVDLSILFFVVILARMVGVL